MQKKSWEEQRLSRGSPLAWVGVYLNKVYFNKQSKLQRGDNRSVPKPSELTFDTAKHSKAAFKLRQNLINDGCEMLNTSLYWDQ